jgi:hypothetical protein
MPEPRRFPPPWRADKISGGYVVRDASARLPELLGRGERGLGPLARRVAAASPSSPAREGGRRGGAIVRRGERPKMQTKTNSSRIKRTYPWSIRSARTSSIFSSFLRPRKLAGPRDLAPSLPAPAGPDS